MTDAAAPLRVLLVGGRPALREVWQACLVGDGADVRTSGRASAAAGACGGWVPEVCLVDAVAGPREVELVLALLGELRAAAPLVAVVDRPSVPEVVALMRAGAADVVEASALEGGSLLAVVRAALARRRRSLSAAGLRRGRRASDRRHVWPSRAMRELYELVEAVASSDASILVLGESGAGKEVVANEVHARSARAGRPFVKIDCSAIPRELMEAELFGHRAGAFTGAFADRTGIFEEANGGSLLLDEIVGMPHALQAKLLRVLQEHEFRPIGAPATLRTDFRLICATNADPEEALRHGRLREDLYYRINTITLHVPPLRERVEDLPLLCDQLVSAFSRQHGRDVRGIAPGAWRVLVDHSWPGNVRELENVLERAVLVARGSEIVAADLPHTAFGQAGRPEAPLPSTCTLAELERRAIVQTLERTGWNKQEAAQLLGLYRPTLYSKMKKHGIRDGGRGRREPAAEPDE